MADNVCVGFVGLGVMGTPMAGHLIRSGIETVVWNRTATKSIPLKRAGGIVAGTMGEVASRCTVVFLCVTGTEDVRECVGTMLPTASRNTLFVDHSTITPDGAQEVHRIVGGAGCRFVDAPVTGGSVGAENGTLTIFCGGSEVDVAEAIIHMRPYTKTAERVGGPGSGQAAKLSNQIAVGGALVGLCECMAFAHRAGLDLEQVRRLVGGGAGGSWAFENYGPKVIRRDWTPGFSVVNQRKDFAYCKESAAILGAQIPTTELVDRLLSILELAGRGGDTTAALYDVLLSETR